MSLLEVEQGGLRQVRQRRLLRLLLLLVQMVVEMMMELRLLHQLFRRSGQRTVHVSNPLLHSGMVAVGHLRHPGPTVHVSAAAVFMVVCIGGHCFPSRGAPQQTIRWTPGEMMRNAA